MYIPTARLQARIGEHLHDSLCDFTYCTRDFKTCGWARWNRKAIALVNLIMPILISEMFPAVRADEREKASYRIEAELVCCDLFDQVSRIIGEQELNPHIQPEDVARMNDLAWHDMCYYAGWAAYIATLPDGPGRYAPVSPLKTDLA